MIILVSDDPVQVEALCTQLRQKGYLFSAVPDDTRALAAVKADRANLLLIDTTSSSFDGFSLCKTVKTDQDLRGLPVLLLTDLADLGVMLKVLDCIADAFITKPWDPEALLSGIDDLQKAQEGERPLSAVRTRFVVTHEGRAYSVVADRRQLLEFLLSAYELAVLFRRELEQTKTDMLGKVKGLNERLSEITSERDTTVRNLHEELEDRNRSISGLTTTLQEKERQESLLRTQTDNLLQDLKARDDTISDHTRLLEEKSVKVASLEGQVAALSRGIESAEQELLRQIDDLNAKLEQINGDLASSKTALAQERQNLSEVQITLLQVQEQLRDESAQNRALKEQVAAISEERDKLASSHEAATTGHQGVQKELEAQRSARDQEWRARAAMEAELAALREKYAGAQQFLDSASRDIGVLNTTLTEERERRKRVEEQLNAALQEIGHKDRAIQSLNEDRSALKNGPDDTKARPSPSGGASFADLPGTMGTGSEPQKPVIDLPPGREEGEGRGQKEKEPLPALPPIVQMILPQPAPPMLLAESGAPEEEVPVIVPPQPEPVSKQDAGDGVPDTPDVPETPSPSQTKIPMDWTVNRNLWFDMIKWVHHTGTIPPDQRKELLGSLMKTSRLVQQGRHLTSRQEEGMRALLARIQALGYRFH
jgi:DNA-binding response OmpR family regulator